MNHFLSWEYILSIQELCASLEFNSSYFQLYMLMELPMTYGKGSSLMESTLVSKLPCVCISHESSVIGFTQQRIHNCIHKVHYMTIQLKQYNYNLLCNIDLLVIQSLSCFSTCVLLSMQTKRIRETGE